MTANKTLFSENSLKKPIIKTTENLHNNKIHDKNISIDQNYQQLTASMGRSGQRVFASFRSSHNPHQDLKQSGL